MYMMNGQRNGSALVGARALPQNVIPLTTFEFSNEPRHLSRYIGGRHFIPDFDLSQFPIPKNYQEAYKRWNEYSYMLLHKTIKATEEEKQLFRYVPFPDQTMYELYYLLLQGDQKSLEIISSHQELLQLYVKIIDIPVIFDSIQSLERKIEIYSKWCEYFKIVKHDPLRAAQIVLQITQISSDNEELAICGREYIQNVRPPEKIIQNLFWAKELVIFAGESGVGKSTFILNLAAALAAEKTQEICLFGKKELQIKNTYKVGIWNAENADFYVAQILENLQHQFGDTFLDNIYFYNQHYFDLQRLCKFIQKYNIDIIILDPLGSIFADLGIDENKNGEVKKCLAEIYHSFIKAGAQLVVMIHHNSKNQERYRGATEIFNYAHTFFQMQKKKDGSIRIYCTKTRYLEQIKDIILKREGYALFAAESGSQQYTEETQKVISFLEKKGKAKMKEICEELQVSKALLSKLTKKQIIVRDHNHYYSLPK